MTFGSDIDERFGGSATYDSCDVLPPKLPPNTGALPNVEAARALLAEALVMRLLIVGIV